MHICMGLGQNLYRNIDYRGPPAAATRARVYESFAVQYLDSEAPPRYRRTQGHPHIFLYSNWFKYDLFINPKYPNWLKYNLFISRGTYR